MGAQNYPGNFHFALLTPDRLLNLLAEAGFAGAREWRAADQECWPPGLVMERNAQSELNSSQHLTQFRLVCDL